MPESLSCRRCGSRLPADAPGGVCPKCMLGVGSEEANEPGGPGVAAAEPAEALETQPLRPSRAAPPDLQAVAERFPHLEVLELLGRGGMGVVYKARHRGLDRLVALKILPPETGDAPGFAERFAREARALARLSHPNIVAVYDFGQVGGQYYLLMEYVDGNNLRALMADGPLPPAGALAIVPQLCDALQYAHDEGVVHRDIKPENILLDKKGQVKVADFGLAKLVGPAAGAEPEKTLTAAWHVLGTPRYMAPEQLEGSRAVDHRADIYSLGVVLYEMLTGEVPMGRFRAPSEKVPVDVGLDEVVLRSLEREPGHRYQHASEVKRAVQAASVPAAPQLRKPPAPPDARVAAPPRRWRPPRWAVVVAVALLLSCLGVLAAYFIAAGRGTTKTLFEAVEKGDRNEAWELTLNRKGSPDESGPGGMTPLMAAAAKGQAEIVRIFLEGGASPGLRDDEGRTALILACANGHDDVVQTLLNWSLTRQFPAAQTDPAVNTRSKRGDTALGLAAARGSSRLVQALLQHGARPDAPADADGHTALGVAAAGGHAAAVNALLAGRADVNARDANNLTALVMAESASEEGMVRLLRERGALEDEHYWFLRGYSLALDGRHADALADLEHVRNSLTGSPAPWKLPIRGWIYTIPAPRGTLLAVLGECYQRAGQPAPAAAAFREAKAAFPPDISVVLYLKSQRIADGHTKEEYSIRTQDLSDHARHLNEPAHLTVVRTELQNWPGHQEMTGNTVSAEGIIH